MDDYLAFAQKLAGQAGQLIKDNFDKNHDVQFKADDTPVTIVDKQINQLVSDAVRSAYPDHGLMGEELDHGSGHEELRWLCDPLDGTKAFTLGVPLSTFVLGLVRQGQVLLAVVYDPYTDHLYHAVRGQGAFCNDQPISVSPTSFTDGGYVVVSETSFYAAEALHAAGARTEPLPGAAYRTMLVANGRCSATIQSGADFHDVGPASLVVEEAGGKVTDLNGASLRYDRPLKNGIILSNGLHHDKLLKIASRH